MFAALKNSMRNYNAMSKENRKEHKPAMYCHNLNTRALSIWLFFFTKLLYKRVIIMQSFIINTASTLHIHYTIMI